MRALITILFLVGFLLVAKAFAGDALDVCRIDHDSKVEKTWCQHWRNGIKQQNRLRSKRTHDRWMAVPCKQLKKYVKDLDCKKGFGEYRFGEPIEG